MISDKIRDILNEQINKEFYSSYLYLSMSAYFAEIGLYGFSHWTKVQSKEEIDHGMILFDYVIGRNSQIHFAQISAPVFDMSSPQVIFEQIYSHERSITSAIDCVATMTEGECDLATRNFIDGYLREQIEEEAEVSKIIAKLKAFGSEKSALYLIDRELMKREYVQKTNLS